MSSPLSMLKKTKHLPLQGSKGGVFRRSIKEECSGGIQEEYFLRICEDARDNQTSGLNFAFMAHSDPDNLPSTSKAKASLRKGSPPSDLELMSSMMQRLTQLEMKVQSQAQEIESKDKKIAVLQQRLNPLKTSEKKMDLNDKDNIVRTCHLLQAQVNAMESFLNDYGLTWVGDGESIPAEEAGAARAQSSGIRLHQPDALGVPDFRMDFDLVLRNVKELNVMAGEGESFVQATATGAHLAKREPIPLRLYSNGVSMFDGPYRSYQDPSTQHCMQDLMDGYFPSEIRDRYPDGVPFEVHDRRDEEFLAKRRRSGFPGKGRVVGGATEKANEGFLARPGKTWTMEQFLNRLPKVVVRAGRVIDIRNSVKATLQGSSDAQDNTAVTRIATPALQALKERQDVCNGVLPPLVPDVATLRVKSEAGDRSYLVTMHFSETIGHLRRYLDKHRGGSTSGYDIISVFPRHCYSDVSQTIQSCGLTSNATLLLRPKPGAGPALSHHSL